MKRRTKWIVWGLLMGALGWGGFEIWMRNSRLVERVNIEPSRLNLLEDDRWEDKQPRFDPELIDSRLLESEGETQWELNASAAVLKMDILVTRSDEALLNKLYPSYTQAATALEDNELVVLPSINSLDGMAKQFDDAVMAAITLHLLSDALGHEAPVPKLVKELRARAKPGSAVHDWTSVALNLAGVLDPAKLADEQRRRGEAFKRMTVSKPLAFHVWTPELERCWVFLKFLQQPMSSDEGDALRLLLQAHPALQRDYLALNEFVRISSSPPRDKNIVAGGHRFLPPAGTKEDALFVRLFGNSGVPANVELMHVLIRAIRAGKIDLAPRPNGGWYDRQVHALESLVLPGHGRESSKLLLTKKYKQRLLEAFRATITKRRETHAGFGTFAYLRSAQMPKGVKPRLRVEPNPTYFVRMARSYRFLADVLRDVFGKELSRPRGDERDFGLREGGRRDRALAEELVWMQRLFYGLHLVACEDIGMRPFLEVDEVDTTKAMEVALTHLEQWQQHADMVADVRVSVPIAWQPNGYRLWCTLGVRAIKLRVGYARPPSLREAGTEGEWQEPFFVEDSDYLLLVDEFAEVHRSAPLNRAELRAICDRFDTREEIVAALN